MDNDAIPVREKQLPFVFDHGIEEPVCWAGIPTVTQLA